MTKAKFEKLLSEYGATQIDDGFVLFADAPGGKQWVDGSTTTLCSRYHDGISKVLTKAEARQDIAERMECGLEPITRENAELIG